MKRNPRTSYRLYMASLYRAYRACLIAGDYRRAYTLALAGVDASRSEARRQMWQDRAALVESRKR